MSIQPPASDADEDDVEYEQAQPPARGYPQRPPSGAQAPYQPVPYDPAPDNRTPQYSRIAPTELTTFRVDAYLGGWRPESDGDMHLILFGMQNQRVSLVAEIPNPNCSGACASGLSEDFAKARAIVQEILTTPNPADEPIVLRVTGVGFFDRNHGQVGAAPNLIELHPVLAIQRVPLPHRR